MGDHPDDIHITEFKGERKLKGIELLGFGFRNFIADDRVNFNAPWTFKAF